MNVRPLHRPWAREFESVSKKIQNADCGFSAGHRHKTRGDRSATESYLDAFTPNLFTDVHFPGDRTCVYSTKSQHHVEERWWHGSARHTLWRDHHFDSCSRS